MGKKEKKHKSHWQKRQDRINATKKRAEEEDKKARRSRDLLRRKYSVPDDEK